MYNRRGYPHQGGPRGLPPGQGNGGMQGGQGMGGNLPLMQQQQQLRMAAVAGRQGVHGGTMLGVHSGINRTLNPANRGPPGISAAALQERVAANPHGIAAGLVHPQQLQGNLRLLATQIQQKQQLQRLHIQRQQETLLQLKQQQQQQHQNMRQSQLHLQQQQQQQSIQAQHSQLQQHQSMRHNPLQHFAPGPGMPPNTPRLAANSLAMSQSGPSQRPSIQPPLAVQRFEGPGPRGGPAVSNQRTSGSMRTPSSWQEPHPNEQDRGLSQIREPRLSSSSSNLQHFDSQDRDGRDRGGVRDDRRLRRSGSSHELSRRRALSPDRRPGYSRDGSNASGSLSNRTQSESSSRGTSASRDSSRLQRRSQNVGTPPDRGRDRDRGYVSSRSARSRPGDGKDRDYDRSRGTGKVREKGKDSVGSQRSDSSSSKKRQREEAGDSKDRPSVEEKGRSTSSAKRTREDSKDTEEDRRLGDREWRPVTKRLRPDFRESKSEKDGAASTAASSSSTTETVPVENTTPSWIRCSPADLHFARNAEGVMHGTAKMKELEELFQEGLIARGERVRASMPKLEPPCLRPTPCVHRHHHGAHSCSSSSSDSSDSDSDDDGELCSKWMEEMERKRNHPSRMHSELWGNDPGQMNNGPLCRCSIKSRKSGLRHDVYPGERRLEPCDPGSNNLDRLHHYRVTMSPSTNFLSNSPTVIQFDSHEFIFEGFSLFTHERLENVPLCKVIRFHIEYTIHFLEEPAPENFTVGGLDLFTRFLFTEVLELMDLDWKGFGGGCNRFHFLPRFARSLPENGKEILSMNEVLKYLLDSSRPLVDDSDLPLIREMDREAWQTWVDQVCGTIVTYPGKKPSSLRVDQLDRTKLQEEEKGETTSPLLVHFGIRPAQLSYAGNPEYQKAWKQYIKFKHLLNSKPKILSEDKEKLKTKEALMQEIQAKSAMKREVTVELSTRGFLRTGLKSDVCQHALLMPVLMSHIRFHQCLSVLEGHMGYCFRDRTLLQLALTHTSFRNNYGTNSAHARNSLTNCGLRQVEYGDRRVYYQNTRKRGINILVDIMSRLGRREETMSDVPHNERLEFLGDAVVELLSSVHLFFLFHWLEEGGLSTYRTALVQNQHLSLLAKNLHLQDFMLYVHGPDLCHESDLRHAMANCFEALMGALFLDGGLETVDLIFGQSLFGDDPVCLRMWKNLPLHPLQEDEPGGDRHWVESSPALQKLITFEDSTGMSFNHVRLLAKAFTHRSVGSDNLLTMGHNQRLEFLGDTVLQLIASEYLYKHFPDHHEGHLSLLRSSLVNSRTQSIVCDDLGMTDYVIYEKGNERSNDVADMKTKQKADLLEAFLGALYVDSGMESCRMLCDVCFFPRLKELHNSVCPLWELPLVKDFILNQDWNDPKSQLQQCCLTLRKMGAGEPDIPFYKVIESLGPSNTRKYVVAVYFRGERLATGTGHSIQQAEMSAANNALKIRSELFPILQHQRRFLDWQTERRSTPQQYRLSLSPAKVSRGENRTGRSRKPAASSSSGGARRSNKNSKNLRSSSSSSSLTVSLGCPRPRWNDSRDRQSATPREGSWSRDYSIDGRGSSMSRSDRGRCSDSRNNKSWRSSPFSSQSVGSKPGARGRNGAGPGSSSPAAPSSSQSPRVGGSADSLSESPPENLNMQSPDSCEGFRASPPELG